MTTIVTITAKCRAQLIDAWLDENVGKTTFRATKPRRLYNDGVPDPDEPQWGSEGHGWRFGWLNMENETWTFEFDDERMASLFLLRWS